MQKKKILIIGKNSYIGQSIKNYMNNENYLITEFDIENTQLEESDLMGIWGVIHVAAIVHNKTLKDYTMYKNINTDLPVSIAKLAKKCGVKQFVFLSTMAVYGSSKKLHGMIIDETTEYAPKSFYGKSKYEAELQLSDLSDENFNIAIIRPANVYGKGCKGNYIPGFIRIVKILPFIPKAYDNVKQGMLYIDNLCELIKIIIDNKAIGIFPAQDKIPISSYELMKEISNTLRLNKKSSNIVGGIFFVLRISLTNKLFGGIAYSQEYSKCIYGDYQLVDFKNAIRRSI